MEQVEGFEGNCASGMTWCYALGTCQIGYGYDAPSSAYCDAASQLALEPFTVDGTTFTPPLSSAAQTDLLTLDLDNLGNQIQAEFQDTLALINSRL